MLNEYFEPFALLQRTVTDDHAGGRAESWRAELDFRGALTHEAGSEVTVGGRLTLRSQPVLLHEFDVTLTHGDRVQRLRDGSVWRVTGQSGDMRTPAFSGLQFAQVGVERLVTDA